MAELSEQEAREHILDLLARMGEQNTWVTGEVELVTRSQGTISGTLREADEQAVRVHTRDGDRTVPFAEIANMLVRMASAGPE